MIKLDNISFSYGENNVLKNFSLEIKSGDRICLFGDSGCGKTTVLRLILGLEKPQSGTIFMKKYLKPAVVFQEDRLLPFKTVLENITLFGANEEKALSILKEMGLENSVAHKPTELSGGMCRRVALARALSLNFDFLVLDEPFTGLDSDNINSAVKLINSILGNRTLILVTHSKAEAEALNCEIKEMYEI